MYHSAEETHVLTFAQMLTVVPDENIRRPLWEFAPSERSAVLHERRRRFGMIPDDEPTGDPEYS